MKHKHPLAELIDDAMTANGWSGADVARRASDAGYSLSPQNISRIRLEPVVTLVAKQARALSAGLAIPVNVVIDATLRSMGFTYGAGTTIGVEEAVRLDEHLGERDRRVILAVVRELTAGADEEVGRHGDAAPITPAGGSPATKGATVHDFPGSGRFNEPMSEEEATVPDKAVAHEGGRFDEEAEAFEREP